MDPSRNLVYVRGQVPGPAGQHVLLRDAFNTRHAERLAWNLPHPTYCGAGGGLLSDLGPAGVAVALACDQLRASGRKKGQALLGAGPEDAAAALEAARALLPKERDLLDVQVFRQNRDPYIPYRKETDYVEVKWKKAD